MKKVIIMRGLPGSGKDRKVGELVEELLKAPPRLGLDASSIVVCSADDFFMVGGIGSGAEYKIGGEYKFDVTKLGEAHAACMRKFLVALKAGSPVVIVNNTNSQHWEYANYELAAQLAGYAVEIEYAADQHHESKHIRIDDVRRFAARNVHGVPLAAVAAMAARWED